MGSVHWEGRKKESWELRRIWRVWLKIKNYIDFSMKNCDVGNTCPLSWLHLNSTIVVFHPTGVAESSSGLFPHSAWRHSLFCDSQGHTDPSACVFLVMGTPEDSGEVFLSWILVGRLQKRWRHAQTFQNFLPTHWSEPYSDWGLQGSQKSLLKILLENLQDGSCST